MKAEVLRLAAACLALLMLAAACGEETVQRVRPALRVVATHEGANKEKLLDYGPVPVLNEKTLKLLVANEGRAALDVRSVVVETTADAFRSSVATGGFQVPGGTEQEIDVTFVPPEEGDFTGTVTLEHNDERVGTVTVLLKGTGSTVGRIEVEPRSVDFGRVGVRTQEVRTVTIRSRGTAALIIESIELAGAPEFSLLGSTSTPASRPAPEGGNPGGAIDLHVACSPTEATEADVLDGTLTIRSTDPTNREIVVALTGTVNEAPIAIIGETTGVPAPGDSIALDGTESHDVDGDDPITFFWTVAEKPFGSEAHIDDPTSPTPNLVTDLPGPYLIGLDVTDAAGLPCLHPGGNPSNPCTTREVFVKPADDLYFELVWDHADTDFDIHLLEQGAALFSDKDCWYGNVQPDFGAFGDSRDDPRLTRDDLRGFGPERIVFSKPPEGGKYDVVVVFAKTNGALKPATNVTLRVFVYGVLEAEMTRTLDTANQRWNVLSLEWPSAAMTEIDTVEMLSEAP